MGGSRRQPGKGAAGVLVLRFLNSMEIRTKLSLPASHLPFQHLIQTSFKNNHEGLRKQLDGRHHLIPLCRLTAGESSAQRRKVAPASKKTRLSPLDRRRHWGSNLRNQLTGPRLGIGTARISQVCLTLKANTGNAILSQSKWACSQGSKETVEPRLPEQNPTGLWGLPESQVSNSGTSCSSTEKLREELLWWTAVSSTSPGRRQQCSSNFLWKLCKLDFQRVEISV